jgi:hypothetical protein
MIRSLGERKALDAPIPSNSEDLRVGARRGEVLAMEAHGPAAYQQIGHSGLLSNMDFILSKSDHMLELTN